MPRSIGPFGYFRHGNGLIRVLNETGEYVERIL